MDVQQLDILPYAAGDRLQRELWERRQRDEIGDTLLLLEHPPVITLGVREEGRRDVLADAASLRERGVELVQSDRGGLATLHAPGQIVGYLIVDMRTFAGGVRRLICNIERGLIAALARFGLEARGDDKEPGIWIADRKIASIGLSVRKRVSRHGFGLNVDTDLSLFGLLNPCGNSASVMTSMARELGRAPATEEARATLAETLAAEFESSRPIACARDNG